MGFIVFGLFASTLSPLIERSYTHEWTLGQISIGAATLAGFLQAVRWGWDPFIAPLVGRILDAKSVVSILLIPLFTGGALLLIVANMQLMIWLVSLLLIFQLTSTMFVTTTDTLATHAAAQTDRVKVMTSHTVAVDLGAALGPLMSFLIIEFATLTTSYLFAGALLILLGIGWMTYKKSNQYQPV
ncbi:MFS transporter [Alkalibacillus aidingensis]|uniref:hypothetical protein n=1 Tax=Alkalibacillus aidingensis TaxID=2747607 RepID=UPI00166170C7|nr:hypothetical protein [Alkalibacillus aidingensis]